MTLSGPNIKITRKKLGISISNVSAATGISRTAIWRYEKGGDMNISNVLKIIDYLGLTLTINMQ